MKRIALCAVAALLTWGAFANQPIQACGTPDFCDNAACNSNCISQGYPLGGACIGRPCQPHVCACLVP